MADPLAPADAAIALRSWPRRYQSVLLPVDEPATETAAVTIGPAGVSATDLAADTVRSLVLLERSLHEVRVAEDPTLHPAIVDRSARHWDAAVHEPPGRVLEQLDDVCASFASEVEATPTPDWSRTGTSAGRSITALEILREALDTAASNLRSMESLLASLA